MKEGPHISIKGEPLFYIGEFVVTNSLLTSVIVFVLFFGIAFFYYQQSQLKKKNLFFYFIHFIVTAIYGVMKSVTGDKILTFFPWLGTLFFYILLQNWFGLLPGVGSIMLKVGEHGHEHLVPVLRGTTADLNTTLALSIIATVIIQYYGIAFLGVKGYLGKFFNFRSPIDFVLGLLEIISEFSRVLSFSFRLYGNIFAGEVLLAIIAFLVPVLLSFPFLIMEIFVGGIQALVFAMLTAVFLNVATMKHH